jgi:hypothetical protein
MCAASVCAAVRHARRITGLASRLTVGIEWLPAQAWRAWRERIEITPQMVESGLDALFVSGLVEWNKPRLAYRGVVERILAAGLSE